MLEAIHRLDRQRYLPPYHLALVHIGLGDADRAFAALEQATSTPTRRSAISGWIRASSRAAPIPATLASLICWAFRNHAILPA
jgi:hypothetical protein